MAFLPLRWRLFLTFAERTKMPDYPFATAARRFTTQFDRDRFAQVAFRPHTCPARAFTHITRRARGAILPEAR